MGKRPGAKVRTDCLMCGWIKEGVVEAATEEDIAAEAHKFHKEHGQLIGARVLRGGLSGGLSRSAKILLIAAKNPGQHVDGVFAHCGDVGTAASLGASKRSQSLLGPRPGALVSRQGGNAHHEVDD